MSQPHTKLTLFYTESNPVAVLVATTGADRQTKNVRYASPEAALEWCREHKAGFVYSPVDADPERN